MHEHRKALVGFAAFLGAGLGALSAFASGNDGGATTVHLRLVSEDRITGQLESFDLVQGATIRTESGTRVAPPGDVASIRVVGAVRSTFRGEATLSLSTGERLIGALQDSPNDAIRIDAQDVGVVTIPLEWVEKLTFLRATQPGFVEAVVRFDRSAPTTDDRLLLTNGDVLRGFISSVGPEAIVIDSDAGAAKAPTRLVLAARFAGSKSPPHVGLHCILSLVGGGRIAAQRIRWSGDEIEMETRYGETLVANVARVERIDVEGGRWEWLSTHDPLSTEQTPMLSASWAHRMDRNVLGEPLTTAEVRYSRGIGVHSRSRLVFDLQGRYDEFVAAYGMDDQSGPLADVSVIVLVDGRTRHEQGSVRRGVLHGPIRINTRDANRIELFVDFGANGDLQDRFNWIEPALIAKSATAPPTSQP